MPGRPIGRRTLISVAVTLVVVVVLAASATILWDRNFRHASPENPGMTCPALIPAKTRPPLTALGVRRVALIGDSIMDQASCSVAASLANLGIETGRYAVPGSGLLTGSVNWLSQTQQILRLEHPDVVVAIFVGNYPGPPIQTAAGQPVAVDSPAFFDAWQQRAEQLSAEVRAAGAQMFSVSPPPISLPPLGHAQRLFDGYRLIRGDHFLNSGTILAGPNGSDVMTKLTCEHVRIVRSVVEAVHLSNDGARIYGQQIAHDLAAQLGLLTTPKPC